MNGRWTELETDPDPDVSIASRSSALGTLIFIGSESVFFASLIAAAIHLRIHNSDARRRLGAEITLPLINTVVLFTSGVTAHYAQTAYRDASPRTASSSCSSSPSSSVRRSSAASAGSTPTRLRPHRLDLNARSFYTLTGFHGFHVVCGLAVLVYLLFRARRELRLRPGERRPPEPSPGHLAAWSTAAPTTGTSSTPCGSFVFIVVYLL